MYRKWLIVPINVILFYITLYYVMTYDYTIGNYDNITQKKTHYGSGTQSLVVVRKRRNRNKLFSAKEVYPEVRAYIKYKDEATVQELIATTGINRA